MATVYFTFGIHNHQPVGNFDFIFEEAYQRSYLPFLEILEQHAKIRIAEHFSGILFDWILEHHPDYFERLSVLVARGQIEMITGAHYEPILMTIPDSDKIGQIRKLTKTVRTHTNYRAKGFWLAERVWEPHLPKVLSQAGIKYTIVDDSHFKYAGLRDEELAGYYVTEEQGATLAIFPIGEKLRYTIPFQEPEATLDYFRELSSRGENQIAVFADDGEKFGVWPGTYDHVFKNGWLERFFTALEEAGDWVKMIHFSEIIDNIPPHGRVYLPTASYREMMEWALPFQANRELEDFEKHLKEINLFDRYNIYVRGGFWRNFLAKYPESNRMHKKMLYVSRKINEQRNKLSTEQKQKALDHLWAGQCNCPYWHGVFGGLYLPHLRHAIYKNLIQAESVLDEMNTAPEKCVSKFDLTGNGLDDIIIETKRLNVYVDPAVGGNIFELDFKPGSVNLLDTMTRREEGYHRKLLENSQQNSAQGDVASIHDLVISKEENLQEHLQYDWYARNALIDHFLGPGTTLRQFADCHYSEVGDFVNKPYESEIRDSGAKIIVSLSRDGRIFFREQNLPVRVTKVLGIDPAGSGIDIEYRIKNLSQSDLQLRFGVEWNVALLAGNSPDRYYQVPGTKLEQKHLASAGELEAIKEIRLIDEWQKLAVGFLFKQPTAVWRFPIETVSLSEAGFERVYQNSVVFMHWDFNLAVDQEKVVSFLHEVSIL